MSTRRYPRGHGEQQAEDNNTRKSTYCDHAASPHPKKKWKEREKEENLNCVHNAKTRTQGQGHGGQWKMLLFFLHPSIKNLQ